MEKPGWDGDVEILALSSDRREELCAQVAGLPANLAWPELRQRARRSIEAGKLELETADFDLRACVHQAVDLLVMDAHRKGLEVLVDIDETLPSLVRGDQARLRQVIVNLFKNAVKFTKDGSITLSSRLSRPFPMAPTRGRLSPACTSRASSRATTSGAAGA